MLSAEKKYEFRKRLRCIHKKDIRDFSLSENSDDFVFKNGILIVLPENSGDVTINAAKDFFDFLLISMKISSSIAFSSSSCAPQMLKASVFSMQTEDYIIKFGENVTISAKNERSLAQAFYRLEDEMTKRRAPFIKNEEISHSFLFSPRMVHSGYGLDQYPNEHLAQIAHSGMDSIIVFVKDVNITPAGFVDFNDLIDRAAKYGLDVYAYSYFVSKMHPEDEGADEYYDELYGTLFEKCPGFKGIVLVGESVSFPSKDENVSPDAYIADDGIPFTKPRPGYYPCYDYPLWLDCVKKAIRKHKSDADIVFWTYNWGYVDKDARLALIKTLPTDISLLVTYEMFETYPHGDIKQTVADYSLAFAGPGFYFTTEAEAAKERGLRLYAMTNTGGLTWDMGCIPYEPMPYQWINRCEGLREANEKYGLCGLMESHHYGIFPSFISDLTKECFIKEKSDLKSNLTDVLIKHFGKNDVDKMEKALLNWSEAIRCYTPTDADQYGAFRCGPSYPLCLIKQIKPPTEDFAHFGNFILDVLYPADYSPVYVLPCGRGMLPSLRIDSEIRLLEKMLDYVNEGIAILKEIKNPNDELLYLINLGEYISCYVTTGINAKKWFVVTSKLKAATKRSEVLGWIEKVKELICAERENAQKAIEFVEKDSRLGWEPSMEYIGDKEHIEWKLRHLDYVEDFELSCFIKGSDDKWFD